MSPSEMIGWECGACTFFTNDDFLHHDCLMCMTERPERYAIVTGTSESASAHSTTVNHHAPGVDDRGGVREDARLRRNVQGRHDVIG